MNVVYISNFFNHHQYSLAEYLAKLTSNHFTFIETIKIPDTFRQTGYPDLSEQPYVLSAWKSKANDKLAKELVLSADVVLWSVNGWYDYISTRLDKGLLTFSISERWLKRGLLNVVSPRLFLFIWHYFHNRWYKKPLYKLCSSAYAAKDHALLHMFKGKCYKWGYFTSIPKCEGESFPDSANSGIIRLIWCARFLKWKHPEHAIQMAAVLKNKGYRFVLDMYGSGELLEKSKQQALSLKVDDCINFCGNVPNEEILKAMCEHDIFLFSSDKKEGWGAVLNEAMSSKCAVVANIEIGAAPYLIKDGINGFIYNSFKEMEQKIEWLINHPVERKQMGQNAYNTMLEVWNGEVAAKNLLALCDALIVSKKTPIEDGPCSIAPVL